MRNYSNMEEHLNSLLEDVYPQPSDIGHDALLEEVMSEWAEPLTRIKSVLDVGCGSSTIAYPYFKSREIQYTGIALGEDSSIHSDATVLDMDMSFLDFADESYDAIFARHVLEHSPMPLLTLMEWHRVASKFLFLVLPNPAHFGYIGRNHYSVMQVQQVRWLLRRSGWRIISKNYTGTEYRFFCEKLPVIGYEGYAAIPLDPEIYEEDRDG